MKTTVGKEVFDNLHKEGTEYVYLREKCDCGHRIRHNNGGNYHHILRFKRDESGYYWYKDTSTCELTSRKWRRTDANEVEEKIAMFIEKHGLPNIYHGKKPLRYKIMSLVYRLRQNFAGGVSVFSNLDKLKTHQVVKIVF